MADEKISQLTDGGAPQDTDQLVIARSGSSLSLLFSAVKAAIPGGVASVFGRTGAVVAANGDYTAAQVGALPSTETLDQIATANATAANVSMNSHKITNLTNGSGAQDAAAFGQIPTALPPNGTAGGDLAGSYPNPTVKAITETSGPTDLVVGTVTDGQFLKRVGGTVVSAAAGTGTVTSVTAGDTSIVVGGTGAAPTIETATLDVIAADHAPAADWSNNSHKITSLANGSGAQDAAAFGQIPTALPPNGTAGGDLSGTYPNPSVKAITETSGPTDLTIGTITDGQFLKRSGSTLVSGTAGSLDQYPNTYLTVADETIPANTQVIYDEYLELAASFVFELASGAELALSSTPSALAPNLITAQPGSGLVQLFNTTLAANTATIIANIPAGHGSLEVRMVGRSAAAVVSDNLQVQFNDDAGASSYDFAWNRNLTGTVADAHGTGQANAPMGSLLGTSASGNQPCVAAFSIPLYDQTTFDKMMVGTMGYFFNPATTAYAVAATLGHWRSTAAIYRITFTLGTGPFLAGTNITIYGTQ